jgi:hypothetical protein
MYKKRLTYFVFTVLPFGLPSSQGIMFPWSRRWSSHLLSRKLSVLRAFAPLERISKTPESWRPVGSVYDNPLNALKAGGGYHYLNRFSITITERRLLSAENSLHYLQQRNAVSCPERMQAVSKIISMWTVLGPVCQLRTRSLSSLVGKIPWDKKFPLSELE